ncbi:hypothetical protein HII31_06201 [Pseudocercospora fuligena]|uniref:Uncharacterized protein n=1 Tax=Pseudocercospora fuligena TaxID=685502 RepID=A0A8H6RK11_9PEZI|nr:hypothetical protein HII31_06201 [Pseudocercospora fuligena]
MKTHYESTIEWVSAATPLRIGSSEEQDCEVFSISASKMTELLSAGFVPDKAVLVTGVPSDSYDNDYLDEHLDLLSTAYTHFESQRVGLQPKDLRLLHPSDQHKTSPTAQILMSTFADRVRTELSSQERFVTDMPLNLLNLSADVGSLPPRFAKHSRYNVLKVLDMAQRDSGAGKSTFSAVDVSTAQSFALFASTLAYSRPHHDVLAGNWIRVLQGLKLWPIAVNLTSSEVDDYTEQGPDYVPPSHKIRWLLLHPDQYPVLLMPPGVRVIYATLTLSPCLIEGGMVWDKLRLLETLDLVYWTCANPRTTNEGIPFQLSSTLNKLRKIVESRPQEYCPDYMEVDDFFDQIKQAISRIQSLGCQCSSNSGKRSCRPNIVFRLGLQLPMKLEERHRMVKILTIAAFDGALGVGQDRGLGIENDVSEAHIDSGYLPSTRLTNTLFNAER